MADTTELLEKFLRAQDDLVLQYNDLGLQTLADWVEAGVIDVAPDFQRRDRWNPSKQSLLIESFLLNLPIPPVYLAENAAGTYSVIDGRQRLTAIQAFLQGDLALRGLQELPELDGLRYPDLPPVMQSTLVMRPLRSVTLLRQTDPELKYLVFHRLNSAGEVLNAQEIRNVAYRGPLNDLLHQLAEEDFLRQQLKIIGPSSSSYRKMADVEYVLRFLSLSENWRRFSGDFALTMDSFMEKYQYAEPAELDIFAQRFRSALGACASVYGEHAFRRPDGNGWRDQTLAGLYDAQMIAFYEVGPASTKIVRERAEHAILGLRKLFARPDFENAVRVGTNTPSRIRLRIEAMTAQLRLIADGE